MTICIKIYSCAHADSMAKNSTINNHRIDMEPVNYALYVAAVADLLLWLWCVLWHCVHTALIARIYH